MRYIGAPRWRNLLIPVAFVAMFPMALVHLLTFGTVRAMRAWMDFTDWCFYER
jgi:hypothetical protein